MPAGHHQPALGFDKDEGSPPQTFDDTGESAGGSYCRIFCNAQLPDISVERDT